MIVGDTVSPTFGRSLWALATTAAVNPILASASAVAAPAGPLPKMTTSHSCRRASVRSRSSGAGGRGMGAAIVRRPFWYVFALQAVLRRLRRRGRLRRPGPWQQVAAAEIVD